VPETAFIVLNCVKVANKICYIPKRTLVMASSRDIEVEEYEVTVGHPDSSPVLRRSSSAESFFRVLQYRRLSTNGDRAFPVSAEFSAVEDS